MSQREVESSMSIPETKSVSRGVLWMVIVISSVLLMSIGNLAAQLMSQRIDVLDKRGVENQVRITILERQYAVIDSKLLDISKSQEQSINLLREHMAKSAR